MRLKAALPFNAKKKKKKKTWHAQPIRRMMPDGSVSDSASASAVAVASKVKTKL